MTFTTWMTHMKASFSPGSLLSWQKTNLLKRKSTTSGKINVGSCSQPVSTCEAPVLTSLLREVMSSAPTNNGRTSSCPTPAAPLISTFSTITNWQEFGIPTKRISLECMEPWQDQLKPTPKILATSRPVYRKSLSRKSSLIN